MNLSKISSKTTLVLVRWKLEETHSLRVEYKNRRALCFSQEFSFVTYSVDKESKKRGTLLKLELIPRFLAFWDC